LGMTKTTYTSDIARYQISENFSTRTTLHRTTNMTLLSESI